MTMTRAAGGGGGGGLRWAGVPDGINVSKTEECNWSQNQKFKD
jgi:hypothetical protein